MPTGLYSDYLANKILDHVFGGPDYARPVTLYLGALKAGDVEVTAGSYARVAITNNAGNFPAAAARAKSNANIIPFVTATADWGFIEAIGIYDALAGGNQLAKVPLAGVFKDFIVDDAATDLFKSVAHALVDGQRVRVEALPAVSLPTGVVAGTTYYVRESAANQFKVAAAAGGAAIDVGVGGGAVFLYKSRDVLSGDTLSFAAADLAISHG